MVLLMHINGYEADADFIRSVYTILQQNVQLPGRRARAHLVSLWASLTGQLAFVTMT